jgi:hypothetical protein
VPNDADSSEQWGSRNRNERGVSVRRYAFLISPYVRVPNLRVDAFTWDRIARGLPREYKLPDEMMLGKIAQLVKEHKQAGKSAEER